MHIDIFDLEIEHKRSIGAGREDALPVQLRGRRACYGQSRAGILLELDIAATDDFGSCSRQLLVEAGELLDIVRDQSGLFEIHGVFLDRDAGNASSRNRAINSSKATEAFSLDSGN
jgi:hypothetical protein